MEKSIQVLEREVVEEFALFPEWMDKYEYLIEIGKSLPMIQEGNKTEENLIKGCQSRVWLHCQMEDGRLQFSADSDAIITKGIIALLIRVYNNRRPDEILSSDFGFIREIGLQENLTPTRANGLVSMIDRIRAYATQNQ
ncbi:MAG: SufE family protein [Bacteroidales bacterium]|jgi:cysteine desulfuration protein SufE|nr:SufE family protein [Bacteroidales bacterium]